MRRIADKWVKFSVLLGHDGVRKHIPVMKKYSEAHLQDLLNQYSFVVAKPIVGTGGSGVIKIEKQKDGFRLQHRETVHFSHTWNELFQHVEKIRNHRAYMIQQGINLAKIRGRPVDYRVKMVKKGSSWNITAVVARLARPGLFITNLCRGGELLPGIAAIRRTFPASIVKDKKRTLVGVSRTCTFLLESKFPGVASLGYDLGIDRSGRIWILEVNTDPH